MTTWCPFYPLRQSAYFVSSAGGIQELYCLGLTLWHIRHLPAAVARFTSEFAFCSASMSAGEPRPEDIVSLQVKAEKTVRAAAAKGANIILLQARSSCYSLRAEHRHCLRL